MQREVHGFKELHSWFTHSRDRNDPKGVHYGIWWLVWSKMPGQIFCPSLPLNTNKKKHTIQGLVIHLYFFNFIDSHQSHHLVTEVNSINSIQFTLIVILMQVHKNEILFHKLKNTLKERTVQSITFKLSVKIKTI